MHGSRAGQTVDRNWGAAEQHQWWGELQVPQNVFQQTAYASVEPASGQNWHMSSAVEKRFDFSMPNWSSSSDDDLPAIRQVAASSRPTYQFNLIDSD